MRDPSEFDLEIKASTIHGKGLFTTKPVKRGRKIVDWHYKPEQVMKWKDFKEKYGDDFRYTYSMRRVWKIINCKDNRNIVTFVNDGGADCNCELKRFALFSLRDIEAGEELTLLYPHYRP